MTVKEIVIKYLEKNGFDGLCGNECGCTIEEGLAPCDNDYSECVPGYIVPCKDPENCEYHGFGCKYHMSTVKVERKE